MLRREVLSEEMRLALKIYLDFRHFYRHPYVHRIDWAKIMPLVEKLRDTFDMFSVEMRSFVKSLQN